MDLNHFGIHFRQLEMGNNVILALFRIFSVVMLLGHVVSMARCNLCMLGLLFLNFVKEYDQNDLYLWI